MSALIRASLSSQVRDHLRQQIQDGHWPPEAQIPSEDQLARDFGVSRMTARQAVTELVNEGVLYRIHGRGTFVARPKVVQHLSRFTSFTEDMTARGMRAAARVLAAELIPASELVAQKLRLPEPTYVYKLVRLRLADEEPMAIETAYLPSTCCPNFLEQDHSDSLNALLETRFGMKLDMAVQTLEASLATKPEALRLGIRSGASVLRIQRLYYNPKDEVIQFVDSVYRGDRYQFTVAMRR